MSFIEKIRISTALALALLFFALGQATVFADTARVVKPLLLPISGPLSNPRAEVSGLTWKGDTLVVLPQYPEMFGEDDLLGFFVIPKQKILDAISDAKNKHPKPIDPQQINCVAPGLARIIRGFDGLEAIGIQNNRCYLTVEAKADTGMGGFLLCGKYNSHDGSIHMDLTRLSAIPMDLDLFNIAEESLVIDGQRIITIGEANGRNCNPSPTAKSFDMNTNYLGPLALPNIEYRITDATALDRGRRFWVMNYSYPPERELLKVGSDPEIDRFGLPQGQDPAGCVERLLELRITEQDEIIRTDTPPIYFELLPDGECRNWEGLVKLGDHGFLAMTDQYPGTLLAFIPNPFNQQGE